MAEGAKNPEIWKAACMLDHFDKIQKLKVFISTEFILDIFCKL